MVKLRFKQKRVGTTQRKAEIALRHAGEYCSFEDIDRACEKFLREREPGYAERRLKEREEYNFRTNRK